MAELEVAEQKVFERDPSTIPPVDFSDSIFDHLPALPTSSSLRAVLTIFPFGTLALPKTPYPKLLISPRTTKTSPWINF